MDKETGDKQKMSKSEYCLNGLSCLFSAFVGGVVSLTCSHLIFPNSPQDVLRVKELRIVGPTGKDQILLQSLERGPSIKLIDKDNTQEVRLEIEDTPVRHFETAPKGTPPLPLGNSFRQAQLSFWNLKDRTMNACLSANVDGWTDLTMGNSRRAGYVNISSTLYGSAPGSNISVGSAVHEHFDVSATDKKVQVSVGGLSDRLKMLDSEHGEPALYLDNQLSGLSKTAVFQ